MTQNGYSLSQPGAARRHLRFRPYPGMMMAVGSLVGLLGLVPPGSWADQVEMQNGDRYVGTVLSLSADTLVLRNDVLGTVRLPRDKVGRVTLGDGSPSPNSPPLLAPTIGPARPTTAPPASAVPVQAPALQQLGAHTNLVRQVQKQFLSDAGPEANKKFEELLDGLVSGKLTVDDLRAEAKSAADQLRALKRDGGEDPGFATDTYLAILDHFLKDTTSAASATNAPPPSPASKPSPAQREE